MFRGMRRFKQQLSEEVCIEVLEKAPRGVLAVLGDEGYPYAVPLDFYYEDGRIYFHCAKEGHKIDALKACDKASFCVIGEGEREEGDWALYFNSVIAFGRVHALEDHAEVLEMVRRIGLKYYPEAEDVEAELERSGNRVNCLVLEIEHMSGKRVHEK